MYLQVRPGRVESAVVQLKAARGVRNAVAVVGEWDVLAAMQGPDLQGVAETVIRQVHRIEGVKRTVTAPVVPAASLGIVAGALPMQHQGDACFVHVKAAAGAALGLAEALAEMEDVSAACVLAGEYDVLAEIPMPWEQAARVIIEEIPAFQGVVSTRTLVAVPYLEPEDEDRDQFSAWE